MQLTNIAREKILKVAYEITTDHHGDVIYIDYYDETGEMIDSVLRDSDGNDLSHLDDAAALMEQIQELIEITDTELF